VPKKCVTSACLVIVNAGELQWLTWEDIDWSANVLRIQPKEGWKPKTGDERAVPLSDTSRTLLSSLPRKHRWVFTMPPSRTCPVSGRQWTERRLLAALKQVLKKVGLTGKLHMFRHTFISDALLKGTPVAVVRDWVGHVDPQIIQHYTHVHNEASQAAMQRLSEANKVLQPSKEAQDGKESSSAQN
jgi:integrase